MDDAEQVEQFKYEVKSWIEVLEEHVKVNRRAKRPIKFFVWWVVIRLLRLILAQLDKEWKELANKAGERSEGDGRSATEGT